MSFHTKNAPMRGIVAVRADAAGDPKVIFAELQKTFEAFKKEHAEQLKDLRKGQEDVVKAEKVDRINDQLGTLQAALDEQSTMISALQLGGPGVQGQPKDPEYSAAFRSHFRKGEVKAALNKGADDEGGYLAPVEWDRTITEKLVEVSPMRQIAMVQQISTNGFKKVFNERGTASGWVGETTARPTTATPTLGVMTYNTGELFANPSATQQMLDDSVIELESWLAGEVETEFSYQEGLAFVAGDGTNKPAGFLTYATGAANAAAHPFGAIQVTTAAAAAAIVPDELITLAYSLPGAMAQNARFTMNRNSLSAVRKLKDSTNNYLWQPSLSAGQPQTLLSYPITEMAAMPNIATGAIPIAFGDFKRGYLIVDRTGVRVLRDPYTNKPYVNFYTTKRVGGGLLNPEALRVLRMA